MALIGFIGAGNMGMPLVKAVCDAIDPSQVAVCDRHPERLEELQSRGLAVLGSVEEVAAASEYVVIGVKPSGVTPLLEQMAPSLEKALESGASPVLCSIAAGYSLDEFDRVLDSLGLKLPVVRCMPNAGVAIGKGVCLFAANGEATDEQVDRLMELFANTGLCESVDEETLARAIPIFSCSPAYVYMFIESLADAGGELGLERDLAMRLAAQAVYGSAAKVLEDGKHVAALRDEICTPGGMTIAATNRMESKGFRAAVIEGALAAYERSKNMLK